MSNTTNPETLVTQTLVAAAKLPLVRINRDEYLRHAFEAHCTDEQVLLAIAETPAMAGVSAEIIQKAAKAAIALETTKVTAISAAAGIPGGLAMLGTIPADTVQYFAHMIRIAQKLAYLYSWPDLFGDEGDEMDDATMNVLILFLGVMAGASAAAGGVTKLAQVVAEQVAIKLPRKALTKGVIYPLVKKVATLLGTRMTKQIFASGVAKVVPVAGAAVSGGVTAATFLPMCKRLRRHLASSQLATLNDSQVCEPAAD